MNGAMMFIMDNSCEAFKCDLKRYNVYTLINISCNINKPLKRKIKPRRRISATEWLLEHNKTNKLNTQSTMF